MWVRESEVAIQLVEIAKNQRRKHLWLPLVGSAGMTAIAMFAYSLQHRER